MENKNINTFKYAQETIVQYPKISNELFLGIETKNTSKSTKKLIEYIAHLNKEHGIKNLPDLYKISMWIFLILLKFSRILNEHEKKELFLTVEAILRNVLVNKFGDKLENLDGNNPLELIDSLEFKKIMDFSEANVKNIKKFMDAPIDALFSYITLKSIIEILDISSIGEMGTGIAKIQHKSDIRSELKNEKEKTQNAAKNKQGYEIRTKLITTTSPNYENENDGSELQTEDRKSKKKSKIKLSPKGKKILKDASKMALKTGMKYGANKVLEKVPGGEAIGKAAEGAINGGLSNLPGNAGELLSNPAVAKITGKLVDKAISKGADKLAGKITDKIFKEDQPEQPSFPERPEGTDIQGNLNNSSPLQNGITDIAKKIEFKELDPKTMLMKKIKGHILLHKGIIFDEIKRYLGCTDDDLKDMIYFLYGESLIEGSFNENNEIFRIEGNLPVYAEAIVKYIETYIMKDIPS